MKRAPTFFIVPVMMMCICGYGVAGGSDDKTGPNSPVTISIFSDDAVKNPGPQSNPVADYIKKILGITIDAISGSQEKKELLFASGDLPDIVKGTYQNQVNTMVQGGLAIPLDNLLKTNGADVLKYLGKNINTFKTMNKHDKTYFIAGIVNPTDVTVVDANPLVYYYIRWDYYKELGKPAINSLDDLVNILSQMIAKHPQTKDGKKTYGISGWTDWSLWPFSIQQQYTTCGSETYAYDGSPVARYQRSSVWWDGIKFWNKAWRAGIVDPDSFTQKLDAFTAKQNSGQVFSTYASFFTGDANKALATIDENAGYEPVPMGFACDYLSRFYPAEDGTTIDIFDSAIRPIAITKSCKNPDRAMDLINFEASPEGARIITSGLEGIHWQKVNGKAELKDETIQKYLADPEYLRSQGIGIPGLTAMWRENAISPIDNQPVNLFLTTKIILANQTAADRDFCKSYGVEYPGQVFPLMVKQGKMLATPKTIKIGAMTAPPDDIYQIEKDVLDYLMANYTKMILAKDDAEFAAQVKVAQDYIYNNLGYQKFVDNLNIRWKAAYDAVQK